MQTSKMRERINWYKKDFVYDTYSRIVDKFEDYDRITRKKMLDEIYEVYSDYNSIISICTVRELKYLQMILNSKDDTKEFLEDKYEWERKTLCSKFLLQNDFDRVFIPDEIIANVENALKGVDWEKAKMLDKLNEVLVGYCKVQGSVLFNTARAFISSIMGLDEEYIYAHMFRNRLFRYYVYVYPKLIGFTGNNAFVNVYNDYYCIEDALDEERLKQGINGMCPIAPETYRTLFYNDFDINNPKINKFLDELKKLPFFWFSSIDLIKQYAVLNADRTSLKEMFKNVWTLKDYDLTEFFKVLDDAMDEMPSGALNGFTPNQAKELRGKRGKTKIEKLKKYTKQENAHLSKEDTQLFYKIYFALLEFTNNKYKINPKLKIYKKAYLNLNDGVDIIDKLWRNKGIIIKEFCETNPFKFNTEELNIAREFEKGFRDVVAITKYELEYTGIVTKDKVYMIKGINNNIDNVIPYQALPHIVITSIIPFKNVLIYDGTPIDVYVNFGSNIEEVIEQTYKNSLKYYHL